MLRVVNLLRQHYHVKRTIINPTKGVALIDCVLDQGSEAIETFLHQRFGSWTKPPVDVQIDPADGHFRAVQFVLQDEIVQQGPCLELLPEIARFRGVPEFDRSAWPPGTYYIDERKHVATTWTADDTLCISLLLPPAKVTTQCDVDESFTMFFDSTNQLIGFQLFRITSIEKSAIRQAER